MLPRRMSTRTQRCFEPERPCWQVLSGQLVAPELPEPVERTEMADLVDTYGKTIHTWQVDRGDTLPMGAPPDLFWTVAPLA